MQVVVLRNKTILDERHVVPGCVEIIACESVEQKIRRGWIGTGDFQIKRILHVGSGSDVNTDAPDEFLHVTRCRDTTLQHQSYCAGEDTNDESFQHFFCKCHAVEGSVGRGEECRNKQGKNYIML